MPCHASSRAGIIINRKLMIVAATGACTLTPGLHILPSPGIVLPAVCDASDRRSASLPDVLPSIPVFLTASNATAITLQLLAVLAILVGAFITQARYIPLRCGCERRAVCAARHCISLTRSLLNRPVHAVPQPAVPFAFAHQA